MNRVNRWTLTEEVRDRIKPILQEYLDKVENLTTEQVEHMENEELGLDLYGMGINPNQLIDLLEELGYESVSMDHNGWELDFWVNMKRKDEKVFDSTCENLVVAGCGMTFELKIYIEDMAF